MSDTSGKKGLLEQAGDGYLNLLDSVRHSFEQAAWGQEATANLADDFYRWVGPAAPNEPEAERGGGGGGDGMEMENEEEDKLDALTAWIDREPDEPERNQPEREGLERGEPQREGPGLGE